MIVKPKHFQLQDKKKSFCNRKFAFAESYPKYSDSLILKVRSSLDQTLVQLYSVDGLTDTLNMSKLNEFSFRYSKANMICFKEIKTKSCRTCLSAMWCTLRSLAYIFTCFFVRQVIIWVTNEEC